MREQENFLYAESQQVNALAQILLLDSRAMDKTEQAHSRKRGQWEHLSVHEMMQPLWKKEQSEQFLQAISV